MYFQCALFLVWYIHQITCEKLLRTQINVHSKKQYYEVTIRYFYGFVMYLYKTIGNDLYYIKHAYLIIGNNKIQKKYKKTKNNVLKYIYNCVVYCFLLFLDFPKDWRNTIRITKCHFLIFFVISIYCDSHIYTASKKYI